MIWHNAGSSILQDQGIVAVVELALVALQAEPLLVVIPASNLAIITGCGSVTGRVLKKKRKLKLN